MLIIQTLWLEYSENPISHRNGWISAEYNWISWSLCSMQLNKFYSEVELYANTAAKNVLIDMLGLNYSKVHSLPDNSSLNKYTWALAKITTYSRQSEPFLHVDGDVLIWKPFSTDLIQGEVIAQNIEHNSTEYFKNYTSIASTGGGLPEYLQHDLVNVKAYNAGILGGNNNAFFKTFAEISIKFVEGTIDKAPALLDATSYCMLFEQWILGLVVNHGGMEVKTLFEEGCPDSGYTGFDNYEQAYRNGYFHFMGQFKQNRHNLKLMAAQLRKDHPQRYYHILRLCKEGGVLLDFAVYQLPELNPTIHAVGYFIDLFRSFKLADAYQEEPDWKYYYAKDYYIYEQLETFLLLLPDQLLERTFMITRDFKLIEGYNPTLFQQIVLHDTYNLSLTTIDLDNLEMIILDCFLNSAATLAQSFESVKENFSADDVKKNKHLLLEQILNKIQRFIYWGVLIMI